MERSRHGVRRLLDSRDGGVLSRSDRSETSESSRTVKTGTTAIGVSAADGVVLATDKRASLGGEFVANKNVQKVLQVHPRAAMTLVGSVGDAQSFTKLMQAETKYFELRRGDPLDIAALQRFVAKMIREVGGRRIHPLVAGIDEDGPRLASVDGAGGLLTDDFIATGSGMELAYGVLEDQYEEGLSMSAATDLAVETVRSAVERDTASGNGLHVATITNDGVDVTGYDAFENAP
ncbi:proteasome subunit beta [Halorubellus litoreus]|uniref:Proteasome subunit beta n=1 Tax=Halorubellus litoreus TaxID=755308 RepID=A0ABD5VCH2_9EURY